MLEGLSHVFLSFCGELSLEEGGRNPGLLLGIRRVNRGCFQSKVEASCVGSFLPSHPTTSFSA